MGCDLAVIQSAVSLRDSSRTHVSNPPLSLSAAARRGSEGAPQPSPRRMADLHPVVCSDGGRVVEVLHDVEEVVEVGFVEDGLGAFGGDVGEG